MLKKNYEFKNILTKGKLYKGQYIDIYVVENDLDINMLGIAVSKKVANSVKRNKIKRLIKENYRLLEKEAKTGYMLVVLWKKQISFEKADFFNIKNDLIKLFEGIGIL